MSSSEVSVSCCLSISSIILNVEEGSQANKENSDITKNETITKNEQNGTEQNTKQDESSSINAIVKNGDDEKSDSKEELKSSIDIDDEDRELIIK